ncbi:MAG: glycosyl hydrolase family 28 protein [Verrucomicrobiota bacterium]|jgi:polygalacturonase
MNKPSSLIFSCALALMACVSASPVLAQTGLQFTIADYHAVGDGKTVNTKAIQDAIDQCAASGGGVIVVPRGVFLTGALFFKQGVNLRVERDGVLKGTTSMADYPPIYTRWEGIERYWTSALINFVGMTNVTVSGEGMIDGSGADNWGNRGGRGAAPNPPPPATDSSPPARSPAPLHPTTAHLCFMPPGAIPKTNEAGVTVPGGGGLGRPRTLVFQSCSGVTVSGLHFKDEACWCVVFIYTSDAQAENLNVRAAHNIAMSDGMDIDSCHNVHVTACDIDCNDDCISLKSGKDEDGLRVARPCEDIIIEKTRFGFGHGGAAMGSETSGGIRNVQINDCVAEAGNMAPIRFKSQPSRGGVVENITYRNLKLVDTPQAFEFNLEWRMVAPIAPPAKVLPVVRNVKMINVSGSVRSAGAIHGLPASFIQGLTFEDCNLAAQRGLTIENATNVDTSGLHITVPNGEPFTIRTTRGRGQ